MTADGYKTCAESAAKEIWDYTNSNPTIIPAEHYYADVLLKHIRSNFPGEGVRELVEAADAVLGDHDERVRIYGEPEAQPHKIHTMERLRAAVEKVKGERG